MIEAEDQVPSAVLWYHWICFNGAASLIEAEVASSSAVTPMRNASTGPPR